MTNFVTTTYTLVDGAGFEWDVSTDGSISDGENNAFDGAFDFVGFFASSTYELQDSGQSLVSFPDVNSTTVTQREVFVSPDSGFARFFDTITNTSSSPITFSYSLDSNFGTNGFTVADTQSGDAVVTRDDKWVVITSSSDPAITKSGILFTNKTSKGPDSLVLNFDNLDADYTVTIQPGESVSFLSFGVQGTKKSVIKDTLKWLEDLPARALEGLTAEQLDQVVNFKIPSADQNVIGTNKSDTLITAGGDDEVFGRAGSDLILGNAGDDELRGGLNGDTVKGGKGDDLIFGDGTVEDVTTTERKTLSNGEKLSVSLTAPDAGSGKTTVISGFLSRQKIKSEDVEIAVALDISGSTTDTFLGNVTVGDRNRDSVSNTILDAEIAAFEALHRSIVDDAQLPDAEITIFAFNSTSIQSQTFRAADDTNGNGVADVIDYVRDLRSTGGTNFELPLQGIVQHFESSSAGQKALYFISDGENNSGGTLDDEVAQLKKLDVQIQSFGVGTDASEADLDIVDDGKDNDSATIVVDPSNLADELLDPGIDTNDVKSVRVLVNGKEAARLKDKDLVTTPFGLRYFEIELDGLKANKDDKIEIVVVADDGANTKVKTSQILENLEGNDGADLLIGGAGQDLIEGGAGKDTLIGGADSDILRGDGGTDLVSYENEDTGIVIDLSGDRTSKGAARGDRFESIEDATGTQSADVIRGSDKNNVLRGLDGNDELVGGNGNDTLIGSDGNDELRGNDGKDDLRGGAGKDALSGQGGNDKLTGGADNDTLTGGDGNDVFVFKKGDDKDKIKDFNRKSDSEKIDVSDFKLNFKKLKDLMKRDGKDTEIKFGDGDILIVQDVKTDEFEKGDFIL